MRWRNFELVPNAARARYLSSSQTSAGDNLRVTFGFNLGHALWNILHSLHQRGIATLLLIVLEPRPLKCHYFPWPCNAINIIMYTVSFKATDYPRSPHLFIAHQHSGRYWVRVIGDMVTGTVKDATISNCSTGDSYSIRMKTNSHNTQYKHC